MTLSSVNTSGFIIEAKWKHLERSLNCSFSSILRVLPFVSMKCNILIIHVYSDDDDVDVSHFKKHFFSRFIKIIACNHLRIGIME